MNKYLITLFLLHHIVSFSQERRITREANNYFLNQIDSSDVDIAIEKYNQAINLNNEFNIAKFNLANSLFSKGKNEESIDLLEEVISNEVNKTKKANAYYNKGKNEIELYEKNNKENREYLENAASSFKESLKNNPYDDDARFNLEKCLSMLKELDKQEQNEENQDSDEQNEENQDSDEQNEENQDSGEQDEENQDSGEQDEENQDSGEQDEENQDSKDRNDQVQNEENKNNSNSGQTDGESEEDEKTQIQRSQMNQILNAVEQKEKEVKGKVKNVNAVEIKSNIKKTDKDW